MDDDFPTAWNELSRELRRMERTASGAVVPGELRPWCESLAKHLATVARALRVYGEEEEALRRQILRDDLELAHRVESLAKDFGKIGARLSELQQAPKALIEEDLASPSASEEATDRVRDLRRRTLSWIVEARAHAGEVRTFLLEAVNRDRGVAD